MVDLSKFSAEELRNELAFRSAEVGAPRSIGGLLTDLGVPKVFHPSEPPAPLRLDLGCGKAKKQGFTGVDSIAFESVDVVCDLARDRWPFGDATVEEAHCSHMLEHIPALQRAHFFNELYRVLKPDAKATIITPHWCSNRAYGDLTHEWPPVSEMFYWYLNAKWRAENAPHQSFWTCNFDTFQPAYSPHPALQFKAQEFRDLALMFGKEAAQDLICTVIKRAP